MIKITNLTKKFDSDIIIDNLSLIIDKYEKVTIFAPSGSGKTTLLNLILGIDKNYTGKIELFTENYSVIYQDPLLFPYKTIKENIFYFLKLKKRFNIKKYKKVEDIINLTEFNIHSNKKILNTKTTLNNKIKNNKTKLNKSSYHKFSNNNYIIKCNCKKIYDDYKSWLNVTELNGFENYYPYQISGGMKQKVAIIRAFLINPDLILMDEPFKSIDFESKSKIIKFINSNYKNSTIVFTTHNIDEIPEITHKILFFTKKPLKSPQIINITSDIKSCKNLLTLLQKIC